MDLAPAMKDDMQGLSGAYTVDVLTPDNGGAAPSGTSFMISGGATGTASLFKTTAWTSGALDSYLGIKAQPNNPLSAWLPATNTVDPQAMGYWVFQAMLGNHTWALPAAPDRCCGSGRPSRRGA